MTLFVNAALVQVPVSIRTPARGVTPCVLQSPGLLSCFNPHAREGRDQQAATLKAIAIVSIRTPARGVTWLGLALRASHNSFNPHAREGRDMDSQALIKQLRAVSIRTPARGVTLQLNAPADPSNVFQSARPRGA